jgi:hypothetical protein
LLAAEERRITTEVLWHLREIETRMLFVKEGFTSLFAYCTVKLKYSESQAHRRISAMRLLKQLPEMAVALASGDLNVTTVTQVQSFFIQERKAGKKYTIEEKRELIERVCGKSKFETEKLLIALSPRSVPQESQRRLTEEFTEVRFVMDQEQVNLFEELRAKLAHQNPNATLAELVKMISKLALKQLAKPQAKTVSKPLTTEPKAMTASSPSSNTRANSSKPLALAQVKPTSRYIPAQEKRTVRERDPHECSWIDPKTKLKCRSKFMLEFDHIKPFGLEGSSTAENLRLLCRVHNQYRARETWGEKSGHG